MSKRVNNLEDIHNYLVIPDLHGTYSIYKKVESYIKNEVGKDRVVIFLGDYFDRGESGELFGKFYKDAGSYLVLKALIDLKKWATKEGIAMIFLRGNHELFYEDYYIHGNSKIVDEFIFLKDTIACFDDAFKLNCEFYDEFIDFLSQLEPYYIDKRYKYLFVHAGVDPDIKDPKLQLSDESIYWIREKFLFSKKRLNYTVIFGHTPFMKPFMKHDKIGLDSGVYKRDYFFMLKIDSQNSRVIKLTKD